MVADLERLYASHVDELASRYGDAITAAGLDALVISSGALRSKSPFDDQDFPFRPTPSFAHWLPLVEAECALVIAPGQRSRLLRAAQASYWEGPTPVDSDHFWTSYDVEHHAMDKLGAALPPGRVGFVGDVASHAAAWGIAPARVNPPALIEALDVTRTRKTGYELSCMAEATRRAVRGHRAVLDAFAAGATASELELHLAYLQASSQDDASTPYKNIVALGASAGVLHHVHYGRRPAEADDALLIDAGATYQGYCSDITRTAVRGESGPARLFAALVERVEVLQREICRRVQPGLPYETLHDQTHELLAPIVRELGLIAASDDELVASGATRLLLPHGLGHSLGIQVHDVGMKRTPPRADNPYLRNTSVIAIDQVFTIEPGCYFIPSLLGRLREGALADRVSWATLDALGRFGGIRIEDNLAVREQGVRNLTREAFAAA